MRGLICLGDRAAKPVQSNEQGLILSNQEWIDPNHLKQDLPLIKRK
jgi:hypothetical protein